MEVRRFSGSFGARVTDGSERTDMGAGNQTWFPEEHKVLLSAESSLQPQPKHFNKESRLKVLSQLQYAHRIFGINTFYLSYFKNSYFLLYCFLFRAF